MPNQEITIIDLIKFGLKSTGADGLCNSDLDCGCLNDDLCPCGEPDLMYCVAGVKNRKLAKQNSVDFWVTPLPLVKVRKASKIFYPK